MNFLEELRRLREENKILREENEGMRKLLYGKKEERGYENIRKFEKRIPYGKYNMFQAYEVFRTLIENMGFPIQGYGDSYKFQCSENKIYYFMKCKNMTNNNIYLSIQEDKNKIYTITEMIINEYNEITFKSGNKDYYLSFDSDGLIIDLYDVISIERIDKIVKRERDESIPINWARYDKDDRQFLFSIEGKDDIKEVNF